jgi:hypothetical protein
MMHLHSQDVASDGGINQDAVAKLFGRSTEEPWAVFFREVFQNSNDARLSKSAPFDFVASTTYMPDSAKALVRASVNAVIQLPAWRGLLEFLQKSSSPCLVIADRKTTGLTGGIDPKKDSTNSNFSNFFYKLGRDNSRDSGGGAFGFGRNVFFQSSRANSIFVYSRFKTDTGMTTRFMGMAAGSHYFDQTQKTGRHWWGESHQELPVAPFEGAAADALAETFGISKHLGDDTGTAVMILDPDHHDLVELIKTLRTCAEIYAWPHLVALSDQSGPGCRFEFFANDEQLEDLDPTSPSSPIHSHYVAATAPTDAIKKVMDISLANSLSHETREKLSLPSEHKLLGRLSYLTLPTALAVEPPETYINCGLPSGSSIALYRDAKIIVKYLKVQAPDEQLTVRGTFEVAPTYFTTFRQAENLTHDEWEHGRLGLGRGLANPVKIALDKIVDVFAPTGIASTDTGGSQGGDVLLADKIGKFIDGLTGGGLFIENPQPGGGGGGGGGRVSRPKLVINKSKIVEVLDTEAFADFSFELQNPSGSMGYTAVFDALVGTGDGGSESKSDKPAGTLDPKVVWVRVGDNQALPNGLDLDGLPDSTIITVRVSYPRNSRVRIGSSVSQRTQAGQ